MVFCQMIHFVLEYCMKLPDILSCFRPKAVDAMTGQILTLKRQTLRELMTEKDDLRREALLRGLENLNMELQLRKAKKI